MLFLMISSFAQKIGQDQPLWLSPTITRSGILSESGKYVLKYFKIQFLNILPEPIQPACDLTALHALQENFDKRDNL
jgi:hypothetical protein